MNAISILDIVNKSGIGLFVMDGKLRVEAPKGRLTPELRGKITSHKAEIIRLLTGKSTRPSPRPAPDMSLTYFDRVYRRLDKFSGGGKALNWLQDNFPYDCAELVRVYFIAQRDPGDKAAVRSWAKMEVVRVPCCKTQRYSV